MSTRTPGGTHVTDLILEVFRLNGRLLAAGDRLVDDLGLTSARWQVLGAVAMAEAPEPVAGIARRMGLTRQAVQRVANDLQSIGLVKFAVNPSHQRAQLVVLTERGRAAYAEARARQIPWSDALAEGLDPVAIAAAVEVVRGLNLRLEAETRGGGPEPSPPQT